MQPKECTHDRCHCCGRFVDPDEAWHAPYPPDESLDDGSTLEIYCDAECAKHEQESTNGN